MRHSEGIHLNARPTALANRLSLLRLVCRDSGLRGDSFGEVMGCGEGRGAGEAAETLVRGCWESSDTKHTQATRV